MNSTVKDSVTETNPKDDGINFVVIVVAAAVCVILVLVLVIILVCLLRNRKKNPHHNQQNATSRTTNTAAYANPVLNTSPEQDIPVAVNILPARMIPGSSRDPDEHVYHVDVCIPDDGHKFDIHQKEVVLTDVGGLFKVPKERKNTNNIASTRNNHNQNRGNSYSTTEAMNEGHINPAFRTSIDSDNDDDRTVSNNPNANNAMT